MSGRAGASTWRVREGRDVGLVGVPVLGIAESLHQEAKSKKCKAFLFGILK